MNITIKKNEDSTVEATVVFENESWVNAQKKAFNKIAKDVEIPGFRKGKAPEAIIKKNIDQRKVMDEAINSILPVGYEEIFKQDDSIKPVMNPSINISEIDETNLTVIYTITTQPDIKLGQYTGITIQRQIGEITDADIETLISKAQNDNAELVLREEGQALVEDDTIVMDFDGYVDGEKFEGGSAENYELVIGSGQFIPGFESQLIGVKKGDEIEVNVIFPENYIKHLASKPATFKVKVKDIKQKILPTIDDSFALDLNIEGVSNLEDLKAHYSKQVLETKSTEAEKEAFARLLETISNNSSVVVPHTLVESDTERGFNEFKQKVEQSGIEFQNYLDILGQTVEQVRENIANDARKNLKTMLVMNEIARQKDLKVMQEDIDAEFVKIAEIYKVELDIVKTSFKDRMNEITNELFGRKISDFIRTNNTIQ